jgi:hypothetical protein
MSKVMKKVKNLTVTELLSLGCKDEYNEKIELEGEK